MLHDRVSGDKAAAKRLWLRPELKRQIPDLCPDDRAERLRSVRMLHTVLTAGDDIRSVGGLGIPGRRGAEPRSAPQIEKLRHDGGGADVHRKAELGRLCVPGHRAGAGIRRTALRRRFTAPEDLAAGLLPERDGRIAGDRGPAGEDTLPVQQDAAPSAGTPPAAGGRNGDTGPAKGLQEAFSALGRERELPQIGFDSKNMLHKR